MSIPRLLHQTWKNDDIPEEFIYMAQSWKKKHPAWEYILWTDEENRNFIKRHYSFLLPVYDNYESNIQRVDAVRYFVLYKFGGCYIDIDFECLANIEPILKDSKCIFGKEPPEHCRIHNKSLIISNAFMGAEPRFHFFDHLCEELMQGRTVMDHPNDRVLESTGPFMLSRLYLNYTKKEEIDLLEADLIYPLTKTELDTWNSGSGDQGMRQKLENAYGLHHYAGTWWKKKKSIL